MTVKKPAEIKESVCAGLLLKKMKRFLRQNPPDRNYPTRMRLGLNEEVGVIYQACKEFNLAQEDTEVVVDVTILDKGRNAQGIFIQFHTLY